MESLFDSWLSATNDQEIWAKSAPWSSEVTRSVSYSRLQATVGSDIFGSRLAAKSLTATKKGKLKNSFGVVNKHAVDFALIIKMMHSSFADLHPVFTHTHTLTSGHLGRAGADILIHVAHVTHHAVANGFVCSVTFGLGISSCVCSRRKAQQNKC